MSVKSVAQPWDHEKPFLSNEEIKKLKYLLRSGVLDAFLEEPADEGQKVDLMPLNELTRGGHEGEG